MYYFSHFKIRIIIYHFLTAANIVFVRCRHLFFNIRYVFFVRRL